MKKRVFALFLSVIMIISLLSGCASTETVAQDFPVTVAGVTLNTAPQSVACLNEASASAISALGYGGYLTGAVSEYAKGSEGKLKDLGYTYTPDWSAVYALSPDVLIVSKELSDEVKEALKLREITVINLKVPTLYSEVSGFYEDIAKIFLGETKYKETADTFNSENKRHLETMKTENAKSTKKVAVFIEAGFVVTGDTLAGDLLKNIGINNVAAEYENEMMSAEDLAAANPDVIFCPKGESEALLKMDAYKDVAAVKNGAVYEIDTLALAFAGEGMVSTLQDMTNFLKN